MTWNLVIQPLAQVEIAEAYFHFETIRQGLGEEFFSRVDEVMARISKTPELYALGAKGIRKVRLRQFPYVLGYITHADKVIVLGVLHGSRNPKKWTERLE